MRQHQRATEPISASPSSNRSGDATEFPVREYVGAMAAELAQMARWDGDETLACALDIAADLASRPAGPTGTQPNDEPGKAASG
jgi:hypothetical protein